MKKMACSRGKASPSTLTKNKLFANSAGFCQNPDCNEPLFKTFTQSEISIAEVAHIISVGKAARSNRNVTAKQKGGYDNLILLCPNCHTIVDKAEEDFPEELIVSWKKQHESRIAEVFGINKFSSRVLAREVVEPLFRENKFIFDQYGPLSQFRHNPESEVPLIWLRKIRECIIPNNRKIVNLIAKNRELLEESELDTVEQFKQHVDDFESKHLFRQNINGLTFPAKITSIYV
jgi:hypothetical protein